MVKVLDMPIYDAPLRQAAETVVTKSGKLSGRANLCVSLTGAHGLVEAKRNPSFRAVLQRFHWNLPDGMPVVWVGKLKGASRMERCYGPDLFAEVMRLSAAAPVRHFFCGGKAGVAEKLRITCEERFGNRQCVGTYSPPFHEMDEGEIEGLAAMVNATRADILWIGVSTPKQELLALRLARHTNVYYIITVGAAFDFHTGGVRQAPGFIQRAGLEWFFRLLMEPRRLASRYSVVVPLFIAHAIKDLRRHAFQSRPKKDDDS